MRHTPIILITLFLTTFVLANETDQYTPYVIKKGETISNIVHKYHLTPLYGETEWVTKVLKMNRLTHAQAKKIEPGEIVILPVARELLTENYVRKDEVKTLYSSWRSSENLNSLKEKKYNSRVKAQYMHRNVNIKDADFNIQQTFGAVAEYWSSKAKFGNWDIAPGVLISAARSSDASISSSENISARFSPDYELEVNSRFKNGSVTFIPAISFRSTSFVTNNQEIGIEEVQTSWFKGSAQKDWYLANYKITSGISGAMATTTGTFAAWEASVYSDLQMTNQFSLHLDLRRTFASEIFGNITNYGLGIGYRF